MREYGEINSNNHLWLRSYLLHKIELIGSTTSALDHYRRPSLLHCIIPSMFLSFWIDDTSNDVNSRSNRRSTLSYCPTPIYIVPTLGFFCIIKTLSSRNRFVTNVGSLRWSHLFVWVGLFLVVGFFTRRTLLIGLHTLCSTTLLCLVSTESRKRHVLCLTSTAAANLNRITTHDRLQWNDRRWIRLKII